MPPSGRDVQQSVLTLLVDGISPIDVDREIRRVNSYYVVQATFRWAWQSKQVSPPATKAVGPIDSGSQRPRDIAQICTKLSRAFIYGDRVRVAAFSKQGHLLKVTGVELKVAVEAGPPMDNQRDKAVAVIQPSSFKVKYATLNIDVADGITQVFER